MTMDLSYVTQPLRDLIAEMERETPMHEARMRRAHEHFNRARLSVGLPPLPYIERPSNEHAFASERSPA